MGSHKKRYPQDVGCAATLKGANYFPGGPFLHTPAEMSFRPDFRHPHRATTLSSRSSSSSPVWLTLSWTEVSFLVSLWSLQHQASQVCVCSQVCLYELLGRHHSLHPVLGCPNSRSLKNPPSRRPWLTFHGRSCLNARSSRAVCTCFI